MSNLLPAIIAANLSQLIEESFFLTREAWLPAPGWLWLFCFDSPYTENALIDFKKSVREKITKCLNRMQHLRDNRRLEQLCVPARERRDRSRPVLREHVKQHILELPSPRGHFLAPHRVSAALRPRSLATSVPFVERGLYRSLPSCSPLRWWRD